MTDLPGSIPRRHILAVGSMAGASLALPATEGTAQELYGDAIRLTASGATGRTFSDDTDAVQRAIDTAIRARRPLFIDRAVRVSHLQIEGANGLVIVQTAPIVGLKSGRFDSLITIANSTDVSWAGRLWLSCQWNIDYDCAVAFLAEPGRSTSNIAIHDWAISGAKTAFKLGRRGQKNGLISEITIQNGTSYGCPTVIDASGSETVVTFIGGNLISNHLGGKNDWAAIESSVVNITGAYVTLMGCEIQHNADADGPAFLLQQDPLASSERSSFGSVTAIGCAIEAAGPLIVTRDASRQSPPAGGSLIFLEGCKGYHSQRSFPFIQLSRAFSGRLKIGDGCNFYAGAPRTAPTIAAEGTATIDISPYAFDANFQHSSKGKIGSIQRFSRKTVASPPFRRMDAASAPASDGIVNEKPSIMAASYACPAGGLTDTELDLAISCAAASACRVSILRDSKLIARIPLTRDDGAAYHLVNRVAVGDLDSGTTLTIAIESDDRSLRLMDEPSSSIRITAWL